MEVGERVFGMSENSEIRRCGKIVCFFLNRHYIYKNFQEIIPLL